MQPLSLLCKKGGTLRVKQNSNHTTGLLVGMAAGAALGAAGAMAAAQNQRQVKRAARKVAKGAERAVTQLDRMVGDFIDQHMDG